MKVLFFIEGSTDIRFIDGLTHICDLTIAAPASKLAQTQLKVRILSDNLSVTIESIPDTNRWIFQIASFFYLCKNARNFDVILSQEVMRGSLNATVIGKVVGVPVVTYMGISPLEYFRCRRERGQISALASVIGEAVIYSLMRINGLLATRCLAMGPYLQQVAGRFCSRSEIGLYYGVDTLKFSPAPTEEKALLRKKIGIDSEKFLIILSSRISHEKDPETVLRAASLAREQGLDLLLLNLSGEYAAFIELAEKLKLKDFEKWVLARPPVHPMKELPDYFRCADIIALGSLAEGAAYSTLEGLSCETPVVATAIGGMELQLRGYAQLTQRQDPKSMSRAFLWVKENPKEARLQAAKGREYVIKEWNREKAFSDLKRTLKEVSLS